MSFRIASATGDDVTDWAHDVERSEFEATIVAKAMMLSRMIFMAIPWENSVEEWVVFLIDWIWEI